MTKDEIKKALEYCEKYAYCKDCPCYTYCEHELHKGALALITEQEKEIEQLKSDFKQLQTNAEILAWGVRDLNHENYELTEKVKQAQIDVLNKLKKKTHNYYPSIDSYCISQHVVLVRDIDKLIKEVENEN